MNLRTHKNTIIIFLLLLAVLPYLYMSFFCNPVADDFSYAYKGRLGGFLNTLFDEYLFWNGRYFSNVFVLVNPITFNSFTGYKVMPVIIIFLTFLSLYFFIGTLIRKISNVGDIGIYALSLTLLYLYQMPIISEGIYWYTGAVTYQLGIVFFLFYLGVFVRFVGERYILKNKFIHVTTLILLMFLTVGSNEIMMIVVLLFTLGIYLSYVFNKIEGKKIVLCLFIASVVFGCIVYFAPGNSVRESFFPDNHNFFKSFIYSVAQTGRFFFEWVSSLPLLLMSVLYYPVNKRLSEQIPVFGKSFYLSSWVSFGLVLFVIFIGAFPAYWSTGILGQHRTMNVSYFLFILFWFINLTVIYNRCVLTLKIDNKLVQLFQLLVLLSLVFTKNGFNLIDDFRTGKHVEYNTLMEQRYELIQEQGDTIYFEPIKNPPSTLFVLDITENPNDWRNEGYNLYFKVPEKKIIMKKQ